MKLLTINCHSWQEKDQISKIKILAQTIKENGYDVIALQEVSQKIIAKKVNEKLKVDNYVYVLLQELRKLGVNDYTFVWGFSHIGFVYYEEGLAVLTKHKIEEDYSFFITHSKNTLSWKTRKIVGAKILINGEPITFYSCHLGWWGDETEPYRDQVDNLISQVNKDEQYYLMGDFNNDASVKNEGYDYLLSKGLYDTYCLADEKDNGTTVLGDIKGWDQNKRDLRIDYIFTNRPIRVQSSKVIFNDLNKPMISDHFGVEITIL